jgi:hypothetical protein
VSSDLDRVKWHPSVTVEKYSPDQSAYARERLESSLSWGRRLLVRRLGLRVPSLHGDLLREMFAEPEGGVACDEGNIMVNSGLANLAAVLTGTGNPLRAGPGSNDGAAVVGVGSAVTDALVTDEALGGDGDVSTAWYQAMDALYPALTGEPGVILVQATFPEQAANFSWAEWCAAAGAGAVTAGPALAGVYAGSFAMMNHKAPALSLGGKAEGQTAVFSSSLAFG